MQGINLVWLRRDLRLEDNHPLYLALKAGKAQPIFIFDHHILQKFSDSYDRRVDYIHQALEKIKSRCQEYEGDLWIYHSTPEDAFEKILSEHMVENIFCTEDYEPANIARDARVAEVAKKYGVNFISVKDQVIYHKNDILKKDGGVYKVYTPYARAWRMRLSQEGLPNYPSEKLLDKINPTPPTPMPSLSDIGFEKTNIKFHIPEISKNLLHSYPSTRNLPYLERGTSRLSMALRFGTISVRYCVQMGLHYGDIWLAELIWREFFMQILYHFPQVENQSFRPEYDNIPWRNNGTEFEAWRKGKTGHPLVDAGMRELAETGWMHNRVRMLTANFLTKHLLIDWRWGETWFAQKLLDYDLSANSGNWQWACGSGTDAAPYFRIFNPQLQQEKFDPNMEYIRKWIPELETKFYPQPIISHKEGRARALEVYAKTLKFS